MQQSLIALSKSSVNNVVGSSRGHPPNSLTQSTHDSVNTFLFGEDEKLDSNRQHAVRLHPLTLHDVGLI